MIPIEEKIHTNNSYSLLYMDSSIIRKISLAAAVKTLSDDGQIVRAVCVDPVLLSCGCTVSLKLSQHLSKSSDNNCVLRCPDCNQEDSRIVCENKQLANISDILLNDHVSFVEPDSSLSRQTFEAARKNQSFLTAFQEAFQEAQKVKTEPMLFRDTTRVSTESTISPIKRSSFSSSNGSSGITAAMKYSNTDSSSVKTHTVSKEKAPFVPLIATKNQELLLAKNFPFYRRLFNHKIHPTMFLQAKSYINTSISPNIKYIALLSEKKWEVLKIDSNNPQKQPVAYCEGKSDGSYGQKGEYIAVSRTNVIRSSNFGDPNHVQALNKYDSIGASMSLLEHWEHLTCKLTENLLIIHGTRGFLRIISITGPSPGRLLYTYQSKFPIRCFDISQDESMIAIGITCRDKYTQMEQAVVVTLKLVISQTGELIVASYPFTLPYRDPLILIKFSPDGNLLSVATALESRFMTISITDITRPSLLMKSQRRLDTTLDSEGITDMSYFSDERLMSLTSVSHSSSSPIILDTNIPSVITPDGIARPKLIMRVEEVGSLIHKCCPSPRGDAVAYLGRNGTVYVVSFGSTRLEDHSSRDSRRTVDVANVARGTRSRDSACLMWDKEGYRLWSLDRLGGLTIIDWVSGTVDDLNVSRCKIVG